MGLPEVVCEPTPQEYRAPQLAAGLSGPIFMKSLCFLYEFFMRIPAILSSGAPFTI
jgi:hypothetical protein